MKQVTADVVAHRSSGRLSPDAGSHGELRIRQAGLCAYAPVADAMRAFTQGRDENTADELWLLEHTPVYTLGQAGRREHLLDPGQIPVVQSDRGGQVTYHGPGQMVAYTLVDLRRARIGIRSYVALLEQCVVDILHELGVASGRVQGAPGVYVGAAKVAALGLRARRSCTYHGIALNVRMSLAPFAGINPCGFAGLEVTQTSELGIELGVDELGDRFAARFAKNMRYRHVDRAAASPIFRALPASTPKDLSDGSR